MLLSVICPQHNLPQFVTIAIIVVSDCRGLHLSLSFILLMQRKTNIYAKRFASLLKYRQLWMTDHTHKYAILSPQARWKTWKHSDIFIVTA